MPPELQLLRLAGIPVSNTSFNVSMQEKYKYMKHKDIQEMGNSQWFLHLKKITCVEREREKNLRVKTFATFMFPLFNIEDISMFLFTLSLPDSAIVAII